METSFGWGSGPVKGHVLALSRQPQGVAAVARFGPKRKRPAILHVIEIDTAVRR